MPPRYKADGLPRRVYRKGPSFYYVTLDNKWLRLGRTEREMYKRLAEILKDVERADTLSALFDRYLRDVMPEKAPKTRKDQERQLKRLREVFGKMLPGQVTTQHVARYLDKRGGAKANREMALLSHVFAHAIRWGLATTNPCRGVMRNKERPATRYITDDEFWARWEQCQDHPPFPLLLELLYLTGQRLGDVLRIRESQITDDGIEIEQGKTGKRLILEWTPALTDLVKRCRSSKVAAINPPLIRRRDGHPYTVAGIGAMWRRIEWGDVERFTLRDIRAKSASDHPDGAHLGHTSRRTLERFYLRKPKTVRGL